MKVSELIAPLQKMPQDADVFVDRDGYYEDDFSVTYGIPNFNNHAIVI
jgi:hypothetical protein